MSRRAELSLGLFHAGLGAGHTNPFVQWQPRAPQVYSGTGNNLQMTLLETIMPLAGGRTVKLELLKLPKSHHPVFTTETAFPPC